MRTRSVLLAAFGLVIAIVFVRSFVVLGSFRDAMVEYDALVREHGRADEALARSSAATVDLETGLRGFALTRDPRFLEPYERAAAGLGATLDALERQSPDGAEGRAAAARVRRGLEGWQEAIARPLLRGASAEAERGLHVDGKRRIDAVRGDLEFLRARVAADRAGESAAVRAFERRFANEAWAASVLTALLMVAAWLFVLRQLDAPLAGLALYAEGKAGADTLVGVKGVREVQTLARALDEMAKRTRDELEREQRFAELTSALSAGGSSAHVAAVALRWIAAERGAAGGVLWLLRSPEGPLEPAASIALDLPAISLDGSPLAREAWKTGEVRRVDDVGEGAYHVVRSALVDAAPRALLATPVRAGTSVVGVAELAGSLNGRDAASFERSLLRVGVALQNAVAKERADLLRLELAAANEEQRLQNEELRAQQEELRVQGEELMARQVELAERNEALALASRAKSDFLSTMSHELRTPLNAVLGFADVLLDGAYGELPSAQRAAVADIRDAGRQLLTLVNDILDLAKIEAGRLDVQPEPVEAANALGDAFALLESAAQRKGVRFEKHAPPGSLVCVADRNRLRQVLVNLASNAVKFTPPGGSINLRASAAPGCVRFEVADTGVGIATDDQAHLFQPFAQAESGRAMRHVGTGLGLSICKRLVELMGGQIGLSSKPGSGSTFFFTLPIAIGFSDALGAPAYASAALPAATPSPAAGPPLGEPTPPTRASAPSLSTPPARVSPSGARSSTPRRATPAPFRAPPQPATGPRRKVLVVDDDPMHARVAESVLARGGYDVTREPSAEAALARLDRERTDLLVVDLQLPGLSGAQLLERVRSRPDWRRLPAVVLTARDLGADESRDLARLADLVAQKGVMTEGGFLSSLEGLLARPRGATLLVIDDNETNRRVVRALTASAGYQIIEAEGAAAGIELARRERPDVVIMDVRMPEMDGLEATRRLRADEATRDIPVVAVSAQAMVGDRERALEAGCIAYVTKPVARQELLSAIERALNGTNLGHPVERDAVAHGLELVGEGLGRPLGLAEQQERTGGAGLEEA